MKKLMFLLFLSVLSLTGYAQTEENTDRPQGFLSFKERSFDFKDVDRGTVVVHTFEFTNTGKAPLIIAKVLTTCGCTATKWPKKPVKAGEKSEITVHFDSTGKSGMHTKNVTVISDAQNSRARVNIKVNIVPPAKEN